MVKNPPACNFPTASLSFTHTTNCRRHQLRGYSRRTKRDGRRLLRRKRMRQRSQSAQEPTVPALPQTGKLLLISKNWISNHRYGRTHRHDPGKLQAPAPAPRQFKLITEAVQGKDCLTNFYGMNLTLDEMFSMVEKWQTMIEAHVDVKTTNSYLLHLFCVRFIFKKTTTQQSDLEDLLCSASTGSSNPEEDDGNHDLRLNMLKKPTFELGKLMELHGKGSSSGKATGNETDTKVELADEYEPPV
ncbi:40S ribosomal protein S3a-like [Molossus molossus]|uniref:40S ribosomal protein S3a-like n=1 Tax=Molossus molossus TaxID=27622 RepID=UPI0017479368|nr:40S ribosomal protein S3a-like [Molossus molossus]